MSELIKVENEADKKNLLEQYRILLEYLNKINDIRETSNNWWTGMNVALIGMISYFRNMEGIEVIHKKLFLWTILLLGFVLCCSWLSSISSVKKRIDTAHTLLMELETYLPAKIFTASFLEREKDKSSLTLKEGVVPALFLIGYSFFAFMIYFNPNLSLVI